ncbi:ABC-type nitrate/sulfonate/bicarbonate transport system permease component [Bradyrhizobium sp. AZCC 2262]
MSNSPASSAIPSKNIYLPSVNGLGYLINYAQFTFEISKMYAGIITLSLLGLVLNQGLVLVERRRTAWKGEA